MKISNRITKPLGLLITGDSGCAPYLTGPKLVDFFNECGFDDTYDADFPTRWQYAMDKIVESNGTERLKCILEEYVDPRRFIGQEERLSRAIEEINNLIKHDGYSLVKKGNTHIVVDINGNFIKPETVAEMGHEYVDEQIKKCQQKIATGDFDGAITNARTLCEALLIYVIEEMEEVEVKNDGNIINLWTRAKKALRLDFKKDQIPDFVFQILSGLDTITVGLAGISNNAGDRHATKFKTKRHHAKLAVNSAMTLTDFLIDVLRERVKQGL